MNLNGGFTKNIWEVARRFLENFIGESAVVGMLQKMVKKYQKE